MAARRSGRSTIAHMHAAEPLSHFVDDYLAYLYEVCPTNATLDGVHLHDDLLEDFRRGAIETHLGALAGFARRLDAIPVDGLPVNEQVEHGIVGANIRGRIFELEQTRTWERNPHMYGEILASSLATQAIFTYAPEERACAPRALEAPSGAAPDPGRPRQHQGRAGDLRQGRARHLARRHDLHRRRPAAGVLGRRRPAPAGRSGRRVGSKPFRPSAPTSTTSKPTSAPGPRASFRLGTEKFEQKLRLEEGITLPVDRLLAIATRELAPDAGGVPLVAGRLNGGDPMEAWRKAQGSGIPRRAA